MIIRQKIVRSLFITALFFVASNAVVQADVIGISPSPAVVGQQVTYSAVDDGMGPFPIGYDWSFRWVVVDLNGETKGPWTAFGDGPSVVSLEGFVGEYEIRLVTHYMAEPCEPEIPSKEFFKTLLVLPPNRVVLDSGYDDIRTINQPFNFMFKLYSGDIYASFDASASVEERITIHVDNPPDPNTDIVKPWTSDPEVFELIGGTITDTKILGVEDPQFFASFNYPNNLIIYQSQEIRVVYMRNDGQTITSPTLGTFPLYWIKTGPDKFKIQEDEP